MKKQEAEDGIARAGEKINDLYARAWNTALHPTEHGIAPSLVSVVSIPVLSLASIGQMVGSAVVSQIPADVFEKITGGTAGGGGESGDT